jgi:DHA2 family multidrug resistance protein
LRPDNPLTQGHLLGPVYSLTTPAGVAALNAEVTRQAAMVGYIDDFKLMMLVILCSLPLVLLIRVAPPPPVAVAPTPATSAAAPGED